MQSISASRATHFIPQIAQHTSSLRDIHARHIQELMQHYPISVNFRNVERFGWGSQEGGHEIGSGIVKIPLPTTAQERLTFITLLKAYRSDLESSNAKNDKATEMVLDVLDEMIIRGEGCGTDLYQQEIADLMHEVINGEKQFGLGIRKALRTFFDSLQTPADTIRALIFMMRGKMENAHKDFEKSVNTHLPLGSDKRAFNKLARDALFQRAFAQIPKNGDAIAPMLHEVYERYKNSIGKGQQLTPAAYEQNIALMNAGLLRILEKSPLSLHKAIEIENPFSSRMEEGLEANREESLVNPQDNSALDQAKKELKAYRAEVHESMKGELPLSYRMTHVIAMIAKWVTTKISNMGGEFDALHHLLDGDSQHPAIAYAEAFLIEFEPDNITKGELAKAIANNFLFTKNPHKAAVYEDLRKLVNEYLTIPAHARATQIPKVREKIQHLRLESGF